MQYVLCNVMQLKCWFCGSHAGAFYAFTLIICVCTVYVRVYIYKRMYAYPPTLEAAESSVFVVWIRSRNFKPGHIPNSVT